MKNRILNLLKLVEKTFGLEMLIVENGNHIGYIDANGEYNNLEIRNDDYMLFNDEIEISFNELVDILTGNDPYILL